MEGEIGRANNPLTPVSDRNYHTINGRVDYRTRKLQLSTSYKQYYNVNAPVPLSDFSSHSRNYTANASWAPKDWFSVDASYMKLHLDTVSAASRFSRESARSTLQTGTSLLREQCARGELGIRYAFRKRADLYVGYTITKDTGDGRATPATGSGPVTDPTRSALCERADVPAELSIAAGAVKRAPHAEAALERGMAVL